MFLWWAALCLLQTLPLSSSQEDGAIREQEDPRRHPDKLLGIAMDTLDKPNAKICVAPRRFPNETRDGRRIIYIGFLIGFQPIFDSTLIFHCLQTPNDPRCDSIASPVQGQFLGRQIAGVVRYFLEEVNRERRIQGYFFDYLFSNTAGPRTVAMRAAQSQLAAGALALIGPEVGCSHEALLAAANNVPIISYVSFSLTFT